MPTNYPSILPGTAVLDILSAPNLTGVIQKYKSGIFDPFPADVYKTGPKGRVHGNQGRFTQWYGQRQVAAISQYGAPSVNVNMQPRGIKDVVLMHVAKNMQLTATQYNSLFKPDSFEIQQQGLVEIVDQVKEFKQIFSNLRIAATGMALFQGTVVFDVNGNLLAPGAAVPTNGTEIFYEIPGTTSISGSTGVTVTPYVSTVGQQTGTGIDPFGTGTPILGSAAGSWANNATAIDSQINALLRASVQLTGFEIKHAFYGLNIPHYLRTNPTTQYYMARTPDYNPKMIQKISQIPPGTLGIENWHSCQELYFYDQGYIKQQIAGDNQIVFTAEFDGNWWEMMEGSVTIPKGTAILGGDSAEAMVGMTEEAYGRCAYSTMTVDPVQLKIVAHDTFLPAIKNPQCIFISTVA